MIFKYVDESAPYLGGKVRADIKEINISEFSVKNYSLYGYFTNDKIVLGRFANGEDAFNNENSLMEVTKEDIGSSSLIGRHTFSFDNKGALYFTRESNISEHNNSSTEMIKKGDVNFKEMIWHSLP